jgi:uncharacterized membrane protein HdeD (DUF308 family)
LDALKQPDWLRALEIVTGLLAIILGIVVLVYPDWGVATLVIWLSVGLLFLGIRSIVLGGHKGVSNGVKALSLIAGILSLILAVLVIAFPDYGALTLIWFLSFGLMVYGFGRMFLAYAVKVAPGWMRGSMVAVGVLDVILSVVVLLLPNESLLALVIILAVVLIVSGVEAIVSGAIGRTWLGNIVESVKKDVEKEMK